METKMQLNDFLKEFRADNPDHRTKSDKILLHDNGLIYLVFAYLDQYQDGHTEWVWHYERIV